MILSFLMIVSAWAQGPSFSDVNSMEAERNFRAIATKDFKKLPTEAEKIDWVKARLAWIALERLKGHEAEALKLFQGCSTYCVKYAPEKEWKALKAWAKSGK